MHYVYILYSKKLNKFYVGATSDLKRRVSEHNIGASQFTSAGVPWELAYYEAFLKKKDAIREENFLKTGKGRERRKYLLETYLEDLK
ncbi:MAG: hypothetical protein ACD_15C00160G0001 [uncultured bacterium]|nr:MAG: hypothetical protein ACD_15C00160G0001 [uncultured bacterium]